MMLGEILNGDRTYFPEPVAYDNARNPIIPAQLGARPMPVAVANLGAVVPGFRSLNGLRGFGEILNGDRTYFPEPVAYDNARNPIIPSQIKARPMPVAMAGLGLGDGTGTPTGGTVPASGSIYNGTLGPVAGGVSTVLSTVGVTPTDGTVSLVTYGLVGLAFVFVIEKIKDATGGRRR